MHAWKNGIICAYMCICQGVSVHKSASESPGVTPAPCWCERAFCGGADEWLWLAVRTTQEPLERPAGLQDISGVWETTTQAENDFHEVTQTLSPHLSHTRRLRCTEANTPTENWSQDRKRQKDVQIFEDLGLINVILSTFFIKSIFSLLV